LKRSIASFFLYALAALAQTTQGNITQTVTGDATHTVVTISSTTPGDLVFQCTLLVGPLAENPTKLVYRAHGLLPAGSPAQAVLVIFNRPLGSARVAIREFTAGESQVFGAVQ